MKKLLAVVCLCTMTSGAFAQGLINFFNNANTLVSTTLSAFPFAPTTGPVGSYYFGLVTSPVGANAFTFTGVYGTNQTVAGRFTGGAVQVAGWAAGTARDFEVFGWSQDLGPTFNPAWLVSNPTHGFLGVSAVGWGYPGGFNGTGTLPNLNIFGGATGIQTGFILQGPLTPEPSAATLAVAAVAVLLIFRRRVRRGVSMPDV